MTISTSPYIGRFAPSPSGPLHFGSLITAIASYLDAKHHNGQWLVRMEDIDPPREEAGAAVRILASLKAHGLIWDDSVLYQSTRLDAYANILANIKNATYPCQCSRQRMLELRGIYDGRCQHQTSPIDPANMTSTRISLRALSASALTTSEHYSDIIQGDQQQQLSREVGDFILRRKDGLFGYQLAVVCDDITQGITHIIRGSDLLSSTCRQRYLTQLISPHHTLPEYGHIPVASNKIGQKLSKQNKSAPINDGDAFNNLCRALDFLHLKVPFNIVQTQQINALLNWAIEHWERKNIPQTLSVVVEA
jgi:glutamyl-Q tRNA(Asp) synthetase